MKTVQKLSQHRLDFFDTFGYLAFPGLFNDCIDKIIEEFEDIWVKSGRTHDKINRSALIQFPDQSKYLSSLLDDHRIHYVGDTSWHSDGFNQRPVKSIKLAFYLDPVTKNSGALRVIPGSHRNIDSFGDLLESHLTSDIFGMTGDQIPAVALESNPGDVLVFNHRIKHSSWGGSDARRMFTMNFTERYPNHLIADLKDFLSGEARFFLDRMHGTEMIKTATPERMHHLEQVRENDTHMADVVKELKKTMKEPANG